MKTNPDATISPKMLILADVLAYVIAWGPAIFCWMTTFLFIKTVWLETSFLYWLLLLPIVAAGSLILATFLIRICLPKLKPGVFDIKSKGGRTWFLHFMLTNSINVSGLMPLIYTSYLTRWLYFRAMGAKIDYGVHLSIYARLRDFPLIKIGKGTTLGVGAHISCHSDVGNKVLLGTVEIGEKCFIGMNTILGPKTKIGKNSWIGFGNILLMDRLPDNSKIDNLEWAAGNPKRNKPNNPEE
jgi:acetyltransferase-like isoleucine patch superfamily enzyme